MAKLVFIGEHFAGRVYEFTLEKTTVGRSDNNTLTIHDPSVSHAHCEILVNGPEVIVHDLGSANGTFVNNARLDHQQAQLKSGQVVRFGSVEARLELEASDEEHPASEITAIYEHGRLLRDQRRAEKHPKPTDPSMTLDEGAPSSLRDHTVVMSRPSRPRESTPSAREETVSAEKKATGRIWVLIIGALVLGLAVVIWLLRSKH